MVGNSVAPNHVQRHQALRATNITAEDLMAISVDHKHAVKLLCKTESENVQEMFKRLKYTDDFDLFSMWSCVLLCREVTSSHMCRRFRQ